MVEAWCAAGSRPIGHAVGVAGHGDRGSRRPAPCGVDDRTSSEAGTSGRGRTRPAACEAEGQALSVPGHHVGVADVEEWRCSDRLPGVGRRRAPVPVAPVRRVVLSRTRPGRPAPASAGRAEEHGAPAERVSVSGPWSPNLTCPAWPQPSLPGPARRRSSQLHGRRRQVEVPDARRRRCSTCCASDLGRPLGQGRLQPPGPVRVLHGAGGRRAPGGVRDPGCGGWPAGRSPPSTGWPEVRRPVGRGVLRHRRPASAGSARPGIIVRLEGLRPTPRPDRRHRRCERPALLAHLCRCTGWRTIVEAVRAAWSATADRRLARRAARGISRPAAAAGRARGRRRRSGCGPDVALGRRRLRRRHGPDRRAAWRCPTATAGGWWARRWPRPGAGRQGAGPAHHGRGPRRRSSCPPGDWDLTLRTSWVEPAYLEPDASWCEPGGEPATPLANGGAFGGKATSVAPAAARRAGRPSRPAGAGGAVAGGHACGSGPKRPPIAAGVRADGTGVVRVARTPGIADRDRVGGAAARGGGGRRGRARPRRRRLRAAGWAEAAVAAGRRCAAGGPPTRCAAPTGAGRSAVGRRRRHGSACGCAARRSARRGRAALLLHRRRPHGARVGDVRGARRRRGRRGPRPHHPLVRRAARRSTCRRSTSRSIDRRPSAARAGQRVRRRLRRRGRRRLAPPGLPAGVAHPACPCAADPLRRGPPSGPMR